MKEKKKDPAILRFLFVLIVLIGILSVYPIHLVRDLPIPHLTGFLIFSYLCWRKTEKVSFIKPTPPPIVDGRHEPENKVN